MVADLPLSLVSGRRSTNILGWKRLGLERGHGTRLKKGPHQDVDA